MSSIRVGYGALAELGQRMREVGLEGAAFVISDDRVFPCYGPQVLESLAQSSYRAAAHTVPAGEGSKSLPQAAALYDWLVERRAERRDAVVALGGGVVGDLAGFVAATFLRGMPLVQVPTTLVAQIDSSIGGKVAVNHPQGKNLIGAFHQPRLILIDPSLLSSLPPRELRAGWAEVIKTAFIMDADLLALLEANAAQLPQLPPVLTTRIVERCVQLKMEIVAEDEKDEKGRRIILNYGHTIGHALEASTGYGSYLHGEAVAVGMVGAARLSQRLSLLDRETVERHPAILRAFGLPTRCPGVDPAGILRAMELDKKTQAAAIRWVLLRGVGQVAVVADVPQRVVSEVVQELTRP